MRIPIFIQMKMKVLIKDLMRLQIKFLDEQKTRVNLNDPDNLIIYPDNLRKKLTSSQKAKKSSNHDDKSKHQVPSIKKEIKTEDGVKIKVEVKEPNITKNINAKIINKDMSMKSLNKSSSASPKIKPYTNIKSAAAINKNPKLDTPKSDKASKQKLNTTTNNLKVKSLGVNQKTPKAPDTKVKQSEDANKTLTKSEK